METVIGATQAGRRFGQLLRAVRKGDNYLITIHGRLVAKIVPAREERTMIAARAALLDRLRAQPAQESGHWTRDDLYVRGP